MPQAVAEVTSALGRSSQRREEIWARARQQGLGAGGPQDDAAGTSLDEQLLRMRMQVRLEAPRPARGVTRHPVEVGGTTSGPLLGAGRRV